MIFQTQHNNKTKFFPRFNVYFANELLKYQPISEDASVTKNSMRYRGIEGFIAAVSPFNFTAIGGNLAYTPALMVIRLIITIIYLKKKWFFVGQWSGLEAI